MRVGIDVALMLSQRWHGGGEHSIGNACGFNRGPYIVHTHHIRAGKNRSNHSRKRRVRTGLKRSIRSAMEVGQRAAKK